MGGVSTIFSLPSGGGKSRVPSECGLTWPSHQTLDDLGLFFFTRCLGWIGEQAKNCYASILVSQFFCSCPGLHSVYGKSQRTSNSTATDDIASDLPALDFNLTRWFPSKRSVLQQQHTQNHFYSSGNSRKVLTSFTLQHVTREYLQVRGEVRSTRFV